MSLGANFDVLYLHGFASSPGSKKAVEIAPQLEKMGLQVKVPDLNQDSFQELTISRALKQAQSQLSDSTVVIGSSMGAYLATLLAAQDIRVKALVLMAPAFALAERLEERYGAKAIEEWAQKGTTMVEHYAYQKEVALNYDFLVDAKTHPAFPQIDVPCYMIAGRQDDVVPIETVRKAFAQKRGPGELVELDDEHSLLSATSYVLRFIEQLLK